MVYTLKDLTDEEYEAVLMMRFGKRNKKSRWENVTQFIGLGVMMITGLTMVSGRLPMQLGLVGLTVGLFTIWFIVYRQHRRLRDQVKDFMEFSGKS